MRKLWMTVGVLALAAALWAPNALGLGNCWTDENFFSYTVRPYALIILDRTGSMRWSVACSTGCPYIPYTDTMQRLNIARRGLFAVLDANGNGVIEDPADKDLLGVEFGYGEFTDGTPTVPYSNQTRIGATYNDLWAAIDRAYANSGTPLNEAIFAGKEYMKTVRRNDPLAACRPYFILTISDGADNLTPCAGANVCSDGDDVGRFVEMHTTFTANTRDSIKVFMLGLGQGMPLCLRRALNWAALKGGTDNPGATNSGDTTQCHAIALPSWPPNCGTWNTGNDPMNFPLSGYAFETGNGAEMRQALMDIVRMIRRGAGQSFTTPSVPANFTPGGMLYASLFEPKSVPRWWGHMAGFKLKPDGSLPLKVAGGLDSTYWRWDAGNKLRARNLATDSLTLYTWTGTNRHTILRDFSRILPETLGVATAGERDAIVNFAYGDSASLAWMNDNFHGGVQDAGPPNPLWSSDLAYPDFARTYRFRMSMLYFEGNDAKLHVVTGDTLAATGGVEVCAYIPRNMLKRLRDTRVAHDYNMDGPIYYMHVRKDLNANGPDWPDWRSILVCGQGGPNGGRGGKGYFALDITDPSNAIDPLRGTRPYPYPMWEIDSTVVSDIGQTWGKPAVGSIRLGGERRYVAFLGGGYDCRNLNNGRFILVVDAVDGTILRRFNTTHAVAGPVRMADQKKSGYFDRLYAPDIQGNIWVCNISDTTNPNNWTIARLFFNNGGARPIFAGVSVARDPKDSLWVFAGSGDRDDPLQPSPTNYLYGIRDLGLTDLGLNDLENVTQRPCDTTKMGWYTTLSTTGNTSLVAWSMPLVMADSVYQLAWEPPAQGGGQGCAAVGAGTTWLFVVYYRCPDYRDPSYKRNVGPGVPPPEIGWGLDPGGQAIGITPGYGYFNLARFKKGKIVRSWREEY